MTAIKQQPPYHVGQVVDVLVGHTGRTDYYFQMEVTAINGSELTLSRGIDYNPTIMDCYFEKEVE